MLAKENNDEIQKRYWAITLVTRLGLKGLFRKYRIGPPLYRTAWLPQDEDVDIYG